MWTVTAETPSSMQTLVQSGVEMASRGIGALQNTISQLPKDQPIEPIDPIVEELNKHFAWMVSGLGSLAEASDQIESRLEEPGEFRTNPYTEARSLINETAEVIRELIKAIADRGTVDEGQVNRIFESLNTIQVKVNEMGKLPLPKLYQLPPGEGQISPEDIESMRGLVEKLHEVKEEPTPEIEELDIPGVSWIVKRTPGKMRTPEYPGLTEEEKAFREFMRLPKLPKSQTP